MIGELWSCNGIILLSRMLVGELISLLLVVMDLGLLYGKRGFGGSLCVIM